MQTPKDLATLRVRLPTSAWQAFNGRASRRGSAPGLYADMIFRYLVHNRTLRTPAMAPSGEQELIYFDLAISCRTKEILAGWSQQEQTSLATFGGVLLTNFIGQFERDPRDLRTIHYLSFALDQRGRVSEAELREAIDYCERNPGVRLPPGQLARWLHSRVGALVKDVEREGTQVALTVELIDQMLQNRGS